MIDDERICEECGDDLACEGYGMCSDCLRINGGRDCPLCGDPLDDDQETSHPECLAAWQTDLDRRTCYVCAEPLDDDQPDNSVHPECVVHRWAVAPDPFLRPVQDHELPP